MNADSHEEEEEEAGNAEEEKKAEKGERREGGGWRERSWPPHVFTPMHLLRPRHPSPGCVRPE